MTSGCLVCGKPLVYYFTSDLRTCALCGGEFEALTVCEDGHYVCDKCHASAAPQFLEILRNSDERDPGKLFRQIMALEEVHMHGPEHHPIVAGIMLTVYRNNGGGIDLAAALDEAAVRGGQVPGGTCGAWGACGAAIGAGIYASILTGSSPLPAGQSEGPAGSTQPPGSKSSLLPAGQSEGPDDVASGSARAYSADADAWSISQKLTADCLERIAAVGGPRCCKRTSRIAIETAVDFTKERYGIEIPLEDFPCGFFRENKECIFGRCPYFPKKEK